MNFFPSKSSLTVAANKKYRTILKKALTNIPTNVFFIGRKNEIEKISISLKKNKQLILFNEIEGIGKTSLAIEYINRYYKLYDSLVFIQCNNNIQEAFITSLKGKFKFKATSLKEQFNETIQYLQKQKGKNLLVVDDIKTNEDFKLIKEIQTSFEILVTSRTKLDADSEYIQKVEILSYIKAKELFLKYFKTEENIDSILKCLEYNTLLIELTAKTLVKSNILTIKKLEKEFLNNQYESIKNFSSKKTFNTYIKKLFLLDTLNKKEILLLKKLSLFPSISIGLNQLTEFLFIDDKNKEELEASLTSLCKKGWLINYNGLFKLHKIIGNFLYSTFPLSYDEIEYIVIKLNKKVISNYNVNPISCFYLMPFAVSIINKIEEKNEQLSTLTNYISMIYQNMGELKQALNFKKKFLKDENINLANNYQKISIIYKDLGQIEKALEFDIEALNLKETNLGNKHPSLAISFNNISLLYKSIGELDKALEFQLKDLNLTQEISGDKHPNLATCFNNISMIYKDLDDFENALKFQLKALNLRKKILEDKHPDFATSFNNLSLIYEAIGDFDKALEFQLKAVDLKEEVLGDKHPSLATSFNNISKIYKDLGDIKKALNFQLKALALTKKISGKENPSFAIYNMNISVLYMRSNQIDKAKNSIDIACNIFNNAFTSSHPDKEQCLEIKEWIYSN